MTERPSRRELLARAALAALVAAPFVVYVPRVLLGARTPAPLDPPPAWAHLVVVTASRWDDPLAALAHAPLATLDAHAARVDRALAPSASRAATAASLWTGRFPSGHGVLAERRALPPGAWTIASAARAGGTRTAAFLEEPFVSATGIGGFEEVREDPALGPAGLAALAEGFLARHAGERRLLWLHLADAGPGGAAAAELVGALLAAFDEHDLRPETLLLVGAFRRDAAPDALPEEALAVPLWTVFPGGLFAGRRSASLLSLADLATVVVEILRLPPPSRAAGELPLQARRDVALVALRGGTWSPWDLVQSVAGDVYREGPKRLFVPRDGGAPKAEHVLAGGERWPLPPAAAAELEATYRGLAGYLASDAPPPRAAAVPEPWRAREPWASAARARD